MKKILTLLFICCCLSVSAQQTNSYIYKLDSIRYVDDAKEIFQYDDRWNCIEIKTFLISTVPNIVFDVKKITYDDENRIIKTDYDRFDGEYREIHEYSYNEFGLLEHDIQSIYYDHSSIESHEIYIYEYNEDGQITDESHYGYTPNGLGDKVSHTQYEYENGLHILSKVFIENDITPEIIIYYTYNEQGLCMEINQYGGYHWEDLKRKTVYTYEDGNRTSQTVFGYDFHDVWTTLSRNDYVYDNLGNCITSEYEDSGGMHTQHDFSYDPSIPISEIAGIMIRWDFDFTPQNMVLNYFFKNFVLETIDGPITYHYSSCNGVEEATADKVLIWPNPASEIIHINNKSLFLKVYSLDGKLVLSSEASDSIDISGLPNGCYLLKAILTDGKQKVQKFVKK